MEISQKVKNSLHKPYLEFIEDLHFDLSKFKKDLEECKHLINKDLVIYLQNAIEKSKIKTVLLKFLSAEYSESLDELFSKHFKTLK